MAATITMISAMMRSMPCRASDPQPGLGPGPVGALQVAGQGGVGDEQVVLDGRQDLLLAGGQSARFVGCRGVWGAAMSGPSLRDRY